ncbi:MAG TPA: enoyl-CoA hydratase/isomerase family protein [Alphaproteobacteria bacterium]|nr:enoyl-CoA hydratase/isomerase family protein [Alphaproteobacteria bacterium]
MYESILLRHDHAVSTIAINRPPLNTVTPAALAELLAAFDELEHRAETCCVVLTGSGPRAFCAGASLDDKPRQKSDGDGFRETGRALIRRIETFPKPVIAAIRGWAIGGGFAIAQACDVRIASETAKFRTGDAYIGIVPSWGVSLVRLVHYIGRNRALDMLMLGEDIPAARAYELGLITRCVPDDRFDAEVASAAARLSSGAPLVLRSIKEAVFAQYYEGPPIAAQVETRWADATQFSHDAREGIAAFKERRKPLFKGQ